MASILGLAGATEVILECIVGFAFRLDDLSGIVYARDGWGFLCPLTDQHVHSRIALDEPVDGRNGADGDGVAEARCFRGRSYGLHLLIRKSIGLLMGFVIAFPMNWWLVANHLKNGMMTVRPARVLGPMQDHDADADALHAPHRTHHAAVEVKSVPRPPVPVMALLSFRRLRGRLGDRLFARAGVKRVEENR